VETTLGPEMERIYGPGLFKLRRKILGEAVGVGSH